MLLVVLVEAGEEGGEGWLTGCEEEDDIKRLARIRKQVLEVGEREG